MNIKRCVLALLLTLGLSSALAFTRELTFQPVAPGSSRYQTDGFGRSIQSIAAADSFAALRAPMSPSASDPVAFHDRYVLLGLPLGQFSLSSLTPVTWSGGIGISAVSLSWLTPSGDLPFIDFSVDKAAKQATGSGVFGVYCDGKCVWLDVFGTETAGMAGQYGSPLEVALVPEPASAAMMLAGMMALVSVARRRRR